MQKLDSDRRFCDAAFRICKDYFCVFVAALLAHSVQFVDVVKVSVAAAAHVLILVVQKDLGAALIFLSPM